MKNILIGTMSKANANTPDYIRQLGKLGFECTEVTFGHDCKWLMSGIDTDAFAADCKKALDEYGMEMSALGVYGNPLESDEDAVLCRKSWEFLIDNCDKFGTKLICGFTGRLRDKPVPESIPQYKAVFGDLAARAKERGVRIAFENCNMGGNWGYGNWNIAFNPAAWDLMFEALDAENIGLEWEPAHHMMQLIDPMPQLKEWAKKIFHLHGKDATIQWDVIRKYGVLTDKTWGAHRTPGFGDCNWTDIISILRVNGYEGNIDIEGWHDWVYKGELEMTGQVHGLKYLKNCRGGDFVPNF